MDIKLREIETYKKGINTHIDKKNYLFPEDEYLNL